MNNFDVAFEQLFRRECQRNPEAKNHREKYLTFYLDLFGKVGYIKVLEAKMDEYERKQKSQKRYILQESDDGYFERVENPYYRQNSVEILNFCYKCGTKLSKKYVYCPNCGEKFS